MYSLIRRRKSALYSLAVLGVAVFSLYFAYQFRQVLQCFFFSELFYPWVLPVLFAMCLVLLAAYVRNMLLGFVLYLGVIYAVFDIAYGVFRVIPYEAGWMLFLQSQYGRMLPMLIALLFCVGGYINAKHFRVRRYQMRCARMESANAPLRVAMISDVHLGTSVRKKEIYALVGRINAEAPDVVLMCGDIYEERTTEEQYKASLNAFRGLRARHGVYYIPGNHEYAAQRKNALDLDRLRSDLAATGITMLRDETMLVDDKFWLVGRDDKAVGERAELSQLMQRVTDQYPVIMMDHKPSEMESAREQGIDLHLSGHTHAGQLFPVRRIGELYGHSEMMYGHRIEGEYHAIVSSGAGTWGFPMRIGSSSEIVLVELAGEG